MTTTPPGPREQLDALLDAVAFDSAGVKIGPVRQVYVDDQSGKATFAGVATGLFSADAIVPLHGARLLEGEVHVDHTRQAVRDSPRQDHTEDALTPDQEAELLEHYGLDVPRATRPGRGTSATGDAKGGAEAKGGAAGTAADKAAGATTGTPDAKGTARGGDDKRDEAPASRSSRSTAPAGEKTSAEKTATDSARTKTGPAEATTQKPREEGRSADSGAARAAKPASSEKPASPQAESATPRPERTETPKSEKPRTENPDSE